MAYKNLDKKREANRRGKAKLLEKNPDYYKDWFVMDRKRNPEKYRRQALRRDNARRMRDYYHRNRHKCLARSKLRTEVYAGRIIKPSLCDNCKLEVRLEADHHDYSKPLDVTWLCKTCHALVTRTRIRAGIIL